jgi:hypothetical protein
MNKQFAVKFGLAMGMQKTGLNSANYLAIEVAFEGGTAVDFTGSGWPFCAAAAASWARNNALRRSC